MTDQVWCSTLTMPVACRDDVFLVACGFGTSRFSFDSKRSHSLRKPVFGFGMNSISSHNVLCKVSFFRADRSVLHPESRGYRKALTW